MITCLHAGCLPAIVCDPAPLSSQWHPTLTEVVCSAIYGAPLTPEQGTFRLHLNRLYTESLTLWRSADGPGWLKPHLELIMKGEAWPFLPDTKDDNEKITLAWFAAAERWLNKDRKLPAREGISAHCIAKKAELANLSDMETIEYALQRSNEIELAENDINARAAKFYALLNQDIVSGTLELKAIPVNDKSGVWIERPLGQPPHATVTHDWCFLPLTHDLFDNEIEVTRFLTEAEVAASVFNRTTIANDATLVRWIDIRVSLPQAIHLLSRLSDDTVGPAHARMDKSVHETASQANNSYNDSAKIRSGRKPGPENDLTLIVEFANRVYPPNGEKPTGMSRKEYRDVIRREMRSASTNEGRNIRAPSDPTFSRHGY